MTTRKTDMLLGSILVVVATLWCSGVVATIPGIDDGSRLGARGFPLGLGVLLGCLGAIVLLRSLKLPKRDVEKPADASQAVPIGIEAWAIVSTVGLIFGYGVLMEYTGFLIATMLTVAVAVGPVLGIWRPKLIAGMSVGLSFGIYLILGKLLGVYLPYGKLINIAF
jgi:hypothetical protein